VQGIVWYSLHIISKGIHIIFVQAVGHTERNVRQQDAADTNCYLAFRSVSIYSASYSAPSAGPPVEGLSEMYGIVEASAAPGGGAKIMLVGLCMTMDELAASQKHQVAGPVSEGIRGIPVLRRQRRVNATE
jgi:hypothetical protein